MITATATGTTSTQSNVATLVLESVAATTSTLKFTLTPPSTATHLRAMATPTAGGTAIIGNVVTVATAISSGKVIFSLPGLAANTSYNWQVDAGNSADSWGPVAGG